jgi:hypothetical protein
MRRLVRVGAQVFRLVVGIGRARGKAGFRSLDKNV